MDTNEGNLKPAKKYNARSLTFIGGFVETLSLICHYFEAFMADFLVFTRKAFLKNRTQ